jgi:nucleotide-binding universal stress UspA family protein
MDPGARRARHPQRVAHERRQAPPDRAAELRGHGAARRRAVTARTPGQHGRRIRTCTLSHSSIVAGTSLSEASDAVVATAARVARALGVTIHLVHAFEVPLVLADAPFAPVPFEIPPGPEDFASWGREGMQSQIERLRIGDAAPIVRHVEQGPPHRVLATVAQAEGADL